MKLCLKMIPLDCDDETEQYKDTDGEVLPFDTKRGVDVVGQLSEAYKVNV